MKKSVEEMKAELVALKEAAAVKTAEMVEVSRIQAQIAVYSNENVIKASAAKQLRTETTDKLKQLNLACEEIVNSMPIYSVRTKENRKWNPSKQYGLGNQLAILTGILSGIQFSTQEHKEQMLALTGLDEDLVEETLEAFGNTSYYSGNYGVVVDEIPYDMDKLTSNIALIENVMGLQLDKSKLTSNVMRIRFEVARVRAERNKEEVVKGATLANTLIDTE